MASVIVLSLGPVQDFIATARKCQDLWFGSYLLSDLSRTVAEAVEQDAGGEQALVVPGDLGKGSVANEVIALVADPEETARAARKALGERIDEWIEETFKDIPTRENGGFFIRNVAEAQVRDLIELNWAAASIENGDYASARNLAKRRLAARKATRNWERVDLRPEEMVSDQRYEGPVPKSTLDGSRASVIHESAYPPKNPEWFRGTYKAKPGERLSGVDLLKRVGEEGGGPGRRRPVFHSTSHVSSAALRDRLDKYAKEPLRRWHEQLRADGVQIDRYHLRHAGEYDGYLLYEGRLPEIYEESRKTEQGGGEDPNVVAALIEARRKDLQALLKAAGLQRPPMPYYAFLRADGDRMGVFISEHCRNEAEHRQFSEKLEAWASSCRGIVESFGGSCVYAGGDDVLALAPLHTVLELARELRESFLTAMKSLLPDDASAKGLKAPTLSIGVAIAHNMQPMNEVLELAGKAERLAKDGGRDSLALSLSKRSGGVISVVSSWDQELDQRLPRWARMFGSELLPDKAAFAFEEALAAFSFEETLTDSEPKAPPESKLMISLLTRALERRRTGAEGKELGAEQKVKLLEALGLNSNNSAKEIYRRVMELSNELQIARLFHDAYAEVPHDDDHH